MAGARTSAGIARAAQRLGCEVAVVQAVIDVESGGSGFYLDGRPKILFESHIFSRLTGGKFDRAHPKLSTPAPNRQLYNLNQYPRLYEALQLDADAAVKATSWGLFQIMGFNFEACGEKTITGFLLAMHNNEDAHLALFAEFIEQRDLDEALRGKRWAVFAHGYNGAGYAANAYDHKLAAAYARHKGAA